MVSSAAVTENRFTEQFRKSIASVSNAQLKDLREKAFAFFGDHGFPGQKNEEWKYTNIAPIAKAEFDGTAGGSAEGTSYPEAAGSRVVVVNGKIDRERSTYPAVTIAETFADGSISTLARGNFGENIYFGRNGFTALNTAFLEEGIFIRVEKDTKLEAPVHISFVSDGATASFPRVFVYAERGSQAVIIETYESAGEDAAFTNSVAEFMLEDDAHITHYRVQKENAQSFHIGATGAALGRGSVYDSTNINLGAAIARHDASVKFTAEGGECFVDGLYMLNGGQHSDTHSVIDHTVPNCVSHQTYKGVLNDSSRAVFNGKVFVREGAHGTDAQQSNKNLLLSNDARVDTKPQLEIFNDDVKCSHGATVGQLEDEEVFYLLSRGLNPELARNLLTYGFAEEVINKIKIESIKGELDEAVLHRLNTILEA